MDYFEIKRKKEWTIESVAYRYAINTVDKGNSHKIIWDNSRSPEDKVYLAEEENAEIGPDCRELMYEINLDVWKDQYFDDCVDDYTREDWIEDIQDAITNLLNRETPRDWRIDW